jgi:allantoate deiminase
VRHSSDETRIAAVRQMCDTAEQIASRRGLDVRIEERFSQQAVPMDPHLVTLVEKAIEQVREVPRRIVSGAGHDAMIIAEKVPAAMVFIRSVGGISHHPAEAVRVEDVDKAIRAGCNIVATLAERRRHRA